MEFSESDLTTYWRFCFRNRSSVEASAECGCFSCGAMFSPAEVLEWINEPSQPSQGLEAATRCTATCPRCTFDAVLPGRDVPLSAELLEAMRRRFFVEIADGIRLGPVGPGNRCDD